MNKKLIDKLHQSILAVSKEIKRLDISEHSEIYYKEADLLWTWFMIKEFLESQ